MRPRLAALWLAPAALAADQISKLAVMRTLTPGDPVEVLGSVFRLTFIYNRGAAFGIDLGSPLVHTAVALAALVMMGWLYRSLPAEAGLLRLALALVLGGALGNIIDRLRFGQVVDFFDVGLGEAWRWPVFNVADSCVTVGVFLLAIGYRRRDPTPADPACRG